MNKSDLKNAFSILKSQKLIDCYEIELFKHDNQKFYHTFFKTYDWRYYVICFKNTINKFEIKKMIYENYIKRSI
jgi:hypothetical protein